MVRTVSQSLLRTKTFRFSVVFLQRKTVIVVVCRTLEQPKLPFAFAANRHLLTTHAQMNVFILAPLIASHRAPNSTNATVLQARMIPLIRSHRTNLRRSLSCLKHLGKRDISLRNHLAKRVDQAVVVIIFKLPWIGTRSLSRS